MGSELENCENEGGRGGGAAEKETFRQGNTSFSIRKGNQQLQTVTSGYGPQDKRMSAGGSLA